MTDEQQGDTTGGTGAGSDAKFEQDLDEALSQASLLADELSGQVGDDETPAPDTEVVLPAEARASGDSIGGVAPGARADDEVLSVAEGKGDALPPSAGDGSPTVDLSDDKVSSSGSQSTLATADAVPAADSGGKDAPSFMADFMPPAEMGKVGTPVAPGQTGHAVEEDLSTEKGMPSLEKASAVQRGLASVHSPKLGVVASKPLGVVGTAPPIPAAPPTPAAVSDEAVAAAPDEKASTEKATFGMAMRVLGERLGEFVVPACGRVVDGMEALDKPLSFLGATAKRVIGWVALATLGTGVI
ncbi:MAG: hypothetical protein ACE5EX_06575, partial [Phycisphaerae bacterium]